MTQAVSADEQDCDLDELECTYCAGKGYFAGDDLPGFDPFWHDEDGVEKCPSCNGSGKRKDQTIW